jgi:hypothetical protein
VWVAVTLLCWVGVPALAWAGDRGADGHYEKRESSHFVLYQDVDIDTTSGLRGSRRFEQEVLRVLETAYRAIDETLGLRPERPITVIVHDPIRFDAEFMGLFRFPAAGFYAGRIHIRGAEVVSQRLVAVLHHELVHAALDAALRASVVPPAWLNEGLAEWIEARFVGQRGPSLRQYALLQQVAAAGQLHALDALSTPSFGGLGPNAASLAYLQSFAFIQNLVEMGGAESLDALLSDYVRSGNLERAIRRTYRADLGEIEAGFLASLASARR